jgi:hypothetical protein
VLDGIEEKELLDWNIPIGSEVPEVILGGIIYRMSNNWAIYKKPVGGFDRDEVIYRTLLFCGFNSTGIVQSKSWVPGGGYDENVAIKKSWKNTFIKSKPRPKDKIHFNLV